MRRRALLCVILIAACSYDDPPVDGVRFKCDATHACPDGEMCLGNICQRSAATHDGIVCGVGGTCTKDQRCCVDVINPARCIPAADSCPGRSALCDSRLDCNGASACCVLGNEVSCDAADCIAVACQNGGDCPTDAPNCCPDAAGDAPWGTCQITAC